MPVFLNNQKNFRPSGNVRPSGDLRSDLLASLPAGETIDRAVLAHVLDIPLVKLPPQVAASGGDPLLIIPNGIAISILSEADPDGVEVAAGAARVVTRFRRDYCQLPAGGFANQAAIDAWALSHGWCPVPSGPIVPAVPPVDPRETLRIRLGITLPANMPTAAEGLIDSVVTDLVGTPVGPVGDAVLRTKFQNLFCQLPATPFANNAEIDAFNARKRWCTPVARLPDAAVVPATSGRTRLQAALALPSLPGVIDLTDATADAILALPAAQMVDAFRARFCNPPVFYTNKARDLWISNHQYCSAPPAARSPAVWVLGAAVGAGGLYWLLKKKSKKA